MTPTAPDLLLDASPVAMRGATLESLIQVQKEMRALHARHLELLTSAFDLAVAKSDDDYTVAPTGRPAEISYRATRAEIAAALTLSESTIEREMADAFELTHSYPATFSALRTGQISLAHCRVIINAGRVIGNDREDAGEEIRRTRYESEVLAHALTLTPHRLRPVAQQLAEKYAERTLDERHESACLRRRVYVVEQADGMSDLIAHLPTVEARAIHDRLTRLVHHIEQVENGIQSAQAAATPASSSASEGGEYRAADEHYGAATPVPRRSRDQLRTDVLSDLLRTGTTPAMHASYSAHDGEMNEPGCTAPNNSSAANDSNRAHGASAAAGLAGVHARIQIIVTDETLFSATLRLPQAERPRRSPPSRPPSPPSRPPQPLDPDAPPGTQSSRGSCSPPRNSRRFNPEAFRRNLDEMCASRFESHPGHTSLAPAELVGSELVDTATAKELAASAKEWELIRHHPETGAVISVERYRPSAEIRRFLAARDVHCRFPGCRVPVDRCDIDHTVAAADGGETSTRNLAHLCRAHHTLKHHGDWGVTQTADGTLTWVSPLSKTYTERPPSTVRFQAVQTAPPEPLHAPF